MPLRARKTKRLHLVLSPTKNYQAPAVCQVCSGLQGYNMEQKRHWFHFSWNLPSSVGEGRSRCQPNNDPHMEIQTPKDMKNTESDTENWTLDSSPGMLRPIHFGRVSEKSNVFLSIYSKTTDFQLLNNLGVRKRCI